MRAIIAALALFAIPASAQVLKQVDGLQRRAATPETIARRLDARASEIMATYPVGTTVPRTAQFDGTYPEGAAEIAAMGGNGIILIAIVTHDPAELPLKRAYFKTGDGTETTLTLIGRVAHPVAPGSPTHKLYGDNKLDTFYLLPLDQWATGGTVMVDFAINRSEFKIYEFAPQTIDGWRPGMKSGGKPDVDALSGMLHRLYPGYALPATAR